MNNVEEVKRVLRSLTHQAFDIASQQLGKRFSYPLVRFDLRGRVAGQAFAQENWIRYNLEMALDHLDDFRNNTVWHESAHIIARNNFTYRVRPHGHEWKWVMRVVFGKIPSRCHNIDVSKYLARKTKRYQYNCATCGHIYKVGSKYHGMICRGVSMRCKFCHMPITPYHFAGRVDMSKV